ncbi:MAG: hypothetical protein A2148_05285 [Chloroflexi bacterium RBG_16_68_14]|nr:MAG: hypothetical protein A2148_05285 [Chloroflexi bacterium RBG_16_68_14]
MEQESDWRRHRDGIVASLTPEGQLEEALANRVALLLWRLDRVTRYEVAVTDRHVAGARSDLAIADAYAQGTMAEGKLPEVAPERVALTQITRIIPPENDLNIIMRYETHLHRQCLQTLHEIEALQARRRGEHTHLARLDISSPPSAVGAHGHAPYLSRLPLERLPMR